MARKAGIYNDTSSLINAAHQEGRLDELCHFPLSPLVLLLIPFTPGPLGIHILALGSRFFLFIPAKPFLNASIKHPLYLLCSKIPTPVSPWNWSSSSQDPSSKSPHHTSPCHCCNMRGSELNGTGDYSCWWGQRAVPTCGVVLIPQQVAFSFFQPLFPPLLSAQSTRLASNQVAGGLDLVSLGCLRCHILTPFCTDSECSKYLSYWNVFKEQIICCSLSYLKLKADLDFLKRWLLS